MGMINNNNNGNEYEKCSEIQNRLFENWKEFMDEYTNLKNIEMAGGNCKEAWLSCMKMQQQLFSIWLELISDMQSCNFKSLKSRKKSCPFWKTWLILQKEFLKKWEYTIKMEELSPEGTIEKYYDIWFDMMNESFRILWEERQAPKSKLKSHI